MEGVLLDSLSPVVELFFVKSHAVAAKVTPSVRAKILMNEVFLMFDIKRFPFLIRSVLAYICSHVHSYASNLTLLKKVCKIKRLVSNNKPYKK